MTGDALELGLDAFAQRRVTSRWMPVIFRFITLLLPVVRPATGRNWLKLAQQTPCLLRKLSTSGHFMPW